MLDFCSIILKAISDYKLILKRTLPSSQFTPKLHELGLKRQYIREISDDIGLYKVGLKIIDELRKNTNVDDRKSNNAYRGSLSFLRYLEGVFSKYIIEEGRVIHIDQKASSALISATQLITMSQGNLTKDNVRQIMQYSDVVATYGDKEQKEFFLKVIKENQENLLDKLPKEILSLGSNNLVIDDANSGCRCR